MTAVMHSHGNEIFLKTMGMVEFFSLSFAVCVWVAFVVVIPLPYCNIFFIAHMLERCFIEFPDYSLNVSKYHNYIYLYVCIVLLLRAFFFSPLNHFTALDCRCLCVCVTQLNLITFVGLAEWIAEMNNYRFNAEKYTHQKKK